MFWKFHHWFTCGGATSLVRCHTIQDADANKQLNRPNYSSPYASPRQCEHGGLPQHLSVTVHNSLGIIGRSSHLCPSRRIFRSARLASKCRVLQQRLLHRSPRRPLGRAGRKCHERDRSALSRDPPPANLQYARIGPSRQERYILGCGGSGDGENTCSWGTGRKRRKPGRSPGRTRRRTTGRRADVPLVPTSSKGARGW